MAERLRMLHLTPVTFLYLVSNTFLPSFQIRHGFERRASKKRNERNDQHPQGVAQRAQEEPVSHQGRKNNARHHYEDDSHAGFDVVRERKAAPQKRKQDDLGAPQSCRR